MKIKKLLENNRRWKGCGEMGTPARSCWEYVKWCSHRAKPHGGSSKKKKHLKIDLPNEPRVPLLVMCPEELTAGAQTGQQQHHSR